MANTPKLCSTDGCGRPHYCRGMCSRCYQRHRYETEPEYRARVKAACKSYRLDHVDVDAATAASRAYRAANIDRVRKHALAYNDRYKAENGVNPSARYRPGDPCRVEAGGRVVEGAIAGPAFRLGFGVWRVPIALPWGETVDFSTVDVMPATARKLPPKSAGS